MPKTPPWDEPDEQSYITRDEMAKAIKLANAALEKRILNRETYTLHAQLHRQGDRDPIDFFGNDPDGLGGTGLWPQMKPGLAVPIVNGTVTLTPTQDLYHLTVTVPEKIAVISDGADLYTYDIDGAAWSQTDNNFVANDIVDTFRSVTVGSTTVLYCISRTTEYDPGSLLRSTDLGASWTTVIAVNASPGGNLEAYGVTDYDVGPDGYVYVLISVDTVGAGDDNSNNTFPTLVQRSDQPAGGTFSTIYTDAGWTGTLTNASLPADHMAINSTGTRILICTEQNGAQPDSILGTLSGTWSFAQGSLPIPRDASTGGADQLRAGASGRFLYLESGATGVLHYSDNNGTSWTASTGYAGAGYGLGWRRSTWGNNNLAAMGAALYATEDNGATWTSIQALANTFSSVDYSAVLDKAFVVSQNLDQAFLISTPFGTPSATNITSGLPADADGAVWIGGFIGGDSGSVLHTINNYPNQRFTVLRADNSVSGSITITESGNIEILNPTVDATYGNVIALANVRDWVLLWYEPDQAKYLAFAMRDTSSGGGAGGADLMLAATSVTIASGEITVVTRPEGIAHYIVSGEGASDDVLTTINGGTDGEWLLIRPSDENLTITDAGNIVITNTVNGDGYLAGGENSSAKLYYNAAISKWVGEVSIGNLLIAPDQSASLAIHEGSAEFQGLIRWGTSGVTIASDKITDANAVNLIADTESAAAADNLASIEPPTGFESAFYYLRQANSARVITVKHDDAGGTSGFKLFTADGQDIVLNSVNKICLVIYNGTLDSGNGGWTVGLIGLNSTKTITVQIAGGSFSTTVPRDGGSVGPMPQGGVVLSCVAKKGGQFMTTAIGANAWIGDVHLETAANQNTGGTGTTIFSTKPTITTGNFAATNAILSTTPFPFAAGDWFHFFTDQAGTTAGSITVTLEVLYTQ